MWRKWATFLLSARLPPRSTAKMDILLLLARYVAILFTFPKEQQRLGRLLFARLYDLIQLPASCIYVMTNTIRV